jgi:intein-encoded DNA endonuclease-like protein
VIWYEDSFQWLSESISKRVVCEFGKAPRMEEYKPAHFRAVLCSKRAFEVFTKEFGFVSPQVKWDTPEIIRKAKEEDVASYIAGFFDAEGDVSTKNYVAGFSQKNVDSLEFIRNWLLRHGISCSRIFCADKKSGTNRFYFTSKTNFKKFISLVPFEHPDKKKSLGILLQ